jgi:cytochrome c553
LRGILQQRYHRQGRDERLLSVPYNSTESAGVSARCVRNVLTKTQQLLLVLAVVLCGVLRGIAAQEHRSIWDGVYTEEQAKSGQSLYLSRCASCHGETLGGGEAVPALRGVSFNANWEGVALADLYDRIRMTMPPMNSGSLSRQEYADVLAYVLSASGFPAGKTPLGTDRAALAGIEVKTVKAN